MIKILARIVTLGLVLGCLEGCKGKTDDHERIHGDVAVSEKNFPDEVLREYVAKYIDEDGNGRLSDEEIEKATSIIVEGVSDLKGVEVFYNLDFLSCSDGHLEQLDLSQNPKISWLSCDGNSLTSLDVSKNKELYSISCENNQLTELDVTNQPKLTTLYCSNNRLTSLDISNNPRLTMLTCENNQLDELLIKNNYHLSVLNCQYNRLRSLDIGICSEEMLLVVDDDVVVNKIDHNADKGVPIDEEHFPDGVFRAYIRECVDDDKNGILSEREAKHRTDIYLNGQEMISELEDLSGLKYFPDLRTLYCDGARLTSLNLKANPWLRELHCSNNMLTELDISKNPELSTLSCSSNQLTKLDCSKHEDLTYLDCRDNPLENLNIKDCPKYIKVAMPATGVKLECSDDYLEYQKEKETAVVY